MANLVCARSFDSRVYVKSITREGLCVLRARAHGLTDRPPRRVRRVVVPSYCNTDSTVLLPVASGVVRETGGERSVGIA